MASAKGKTETKAPFCISLNSDTFPLLQKETWSFLVSLVALFSNFSEGDNLLEKLRSPREP